MTKAEAEKQVVTITLVIAAVTAIGTCAGWVGVIVALRQYSADVKEKSESDWEQVEIHKILDENKGLGMSLSDLSSKYATDAMKTDEVHLEKKKLQDLEIRRVLLNLMADKLVYETADDKYLVARTDLVPNGLQSFNVNRALGSISMELAKEGGKTPEQLEKIVPGEAKVTPEDYWTAINMAIAYGLATLDEDGKLWSASNPAKKKPAPDKKPG